jgi:hypothetical protein
VRAKDCAVAFPWLLIDRLAKNRASKHCRLLGLCLSDQIRPPATSHFNELFCGDGLKICTVNRHERPYQLLCTGTIWYWILILTNSTKLIDVFGKSLLNPCCLCMLMQINMIDVIQIDSQSLYNAMHDGTVRCQSVQILIVSKSLTSFHFMHYLHFYHPLYQQYLTKCIKFMHNSLLCWLRNPILSEIHSCETQIQSIPSSQVSAEINRFTSNFTNINICYIVNNWCILWCLSKK